eukprot:2701550-Pyramimonas_sp.AAC.1
MAPAELEDGGGAPGGPLLAIEDTDHAGGPDMDEAAIVEMLGGAVEGAVVHPPELKDRKFLGMKVNYDNFTRKSGRRRAYITCPNRDCHRACFRWTTIDLYPDARTCAASLFAWALAHDRFEGDEAKVQHQGHHPSEAEVNHVLHSMPE